jgi:hypothetical protein
VPALEALQDRARAAHTLAVGISIDSTYSHAAWAEQLGGVSFPLVSDGFPKGEIAETFGTYLADKGITDRATVIIDAGGVVRYSASVTPAGKRDIDALVAECEAVDRAWTGAELSTDARPEGLEPDTTLYIRDRCMFSRWALYARRNLGLVESLPVRNVSHDADALAALEKLGGKAQAPALAVGSTVMYESAEIAGYLARRTSYAWPGMMPEGAP